MSSETKRVAIRKMMSSGMSTELKNYLTNTNPGQLHCPEGGQLLITVALERSTSNSISELLVDSFSVKSIKPPGLTI